MTRILSILAVVSLLSLCIFGGVHIVRSREQANAKAEDVAQLTPQTDPNGPLYFQLLEHSNTPYAQSVRRVINDGPRALIRERALAQKDGIPLVASQLQKPLPPPDQNAAPLYTELLKLLKDKPLQLPDYAKKGMSAAVSYTPEQIADVRRILAQRQDVMALVHQAADRPQCVFLRDWSQGLATQSPEDQAIRQAALLIEIESCLMARAGHYQEAIANQSLGFRIAAHAASTPGVIGYINASICESRTLSGMQSILLLAGPDAAADTQMQESIPTSLPHLSLHDALMGEPAVFEVFFGQMRQAGRPCILSVLQTGDLPISSALAPSAKIKHGSPEEERFAFALMDAWEAYYLQQMRILIDASVAPSQKRRAIFAHASQMNLHDPAYLVKILFAIVMQSPDKLETNDTYYHAKGVITQAAAAVLDAKAKTGKFPNKLPQEFTDPFTNKPLLYRREGSAGFVVYSGGPTGHYDGGKPGEKTPTLEVLFRYPAVPVPPS